jgi:hypothetical protein
MKTARDAWVIALLKTYPTLKHNSANLGFMVIAASAPLIFIILFAGSQLNQGLTGAFVAGLAVSSLSTVFQGTQLDRNRGWNELFLSKPISPIAYSLGNALSGLFMSAPALVFFGSILAAFQIVPPLALLMGVGALLLCWAILSLFGFVGAKAMGNVNPNQAGSIVNVLAFALTYLPPVYYRASQLGSYSWIALLFPTSDVTVIIRSLGPGSSNLFTTLAWVSLVVWCVVGFFLARRESHWREK